LQFAAKHRVRQMSIAQSILHKTRLQLRVKQLSLRSDGYR
jgi:hypothetical protein